jgi:hypothetical protein
MTATNLLSNLAKLSFAVICILLLLNSVPIKIANSLILAQNPSRRKQPNPPKPMQTKDSLPPNPPPQRVPINSGNPPPRNPPCENIQPGITALAPDQNVLISKENPTFWFYVPYKPEMIASVSLLWQDEIGEAYSIENLPKPSTPGIISVSLPPQAPPLKEGKKYNFTLTLEVYCSDKPNATIEIDKIPLNVQIKNFSPAQANTVQKASIYAQKNYWFDALTEIAELKKNNPNDENWIKIFSLMNLKYSKLIAPQPIIDCCTSKNSQSL